MLDVEVAVVAEVDCFLSLQVHGVVDDSGGGDELEKGRVDYLSALACADGGYDLFALEIISYGIKMACGPRALVMLAIGGVVSGDAEDKIC